MGSTALVALAQSLAEREQLYREQAQQQQQQHVPAERMQPPGQAQADASKGAPLQQRWLGEATGTGAAAAEPNAWAGVRQAVSWSCGLGTGRRGLLCFACLCARPAMVPCVLLARLLTSLASSPAWLHLARHAPAGCTLCMRSMGVVLSALPQHMCWHSLLTLRPHALLLQGSGWPDEMLTAQLAGVQQQQRVGPQQAAHDQQQLAASGSRAAPHSTMLLEVNRVRSAGGGGRRGRLGLGGKRQTRTCGTWRHHTPTRRGAAAVN